MPGLKRARSCYTVTEHIIPDINTRMSSQNFELITENFTIAHYIVHNNNSPYKRPNIAKFDSWGLTSLSNKYIAVGDDVVEKPGFILTNWEAITPATKAHYTQALFCIFAHIHCIAATASSIDPPNTQPHAGQESTTVTEPPLLVHTKQRCYQVYPH